MKRKQRVTCSFNIFELDVLSRINHPYLTEKIAKVREKLIAKIKASRGNK
jgi:hypothetical protein